jgi:hypothetical protein
MNGVPISGNESGELRLLTKPLSLQLSGSSQGIANLFLFIDEFSPLRDLFRVIPFKNEIKLPEKNISSPL